MKILLSAVFFLSLFAQLNAQPALPTSVKNKPVSIRAKVDRRIELTSIIARLAGYEEYVRNDFKLYASEVDSYFAKYKNHPAVEFARKVRRSKGIGYDAVPSLAVHLNPDLTPKFAFSDSAPDPRWGKENATEFAKLLGQFYKETAAESFFNSHAALYKNAEERLQEVLSKVDFDWYKNFYGEVPKGSFNLFVGLLNGGMNFGPKVVFPNRKEELYAVIGAWKMDDRGLPIFSDDFLPTIIHEFNHSFINHLVYEREKQLKASGEKIFRPVAEKMATQAYSNWQITMLESLVRAAVARYMFDHGEYEKTSAELTAQRNRGFLWVEELFVLLGTYENSRKTYPTFRSFLPMIEAYSADLAKRIDQKAAIFEQKRPRVVALAPFTNGAQDVDLGITRITITFDQPLSGKGYSINLGKLGRDHYPVEKVVGYSEDRTKFTVEVKLKPDWEYEFEVTGNSFRSLDDYPLKNYTVKFKTGK